MSRERLTGFEAREGKPREDPWMGSREVLAFPEFYQWNAHTRSGVVVAPADLVCTGPIAYNGQAALQTDIHILKAAVHGPQAEELFMTAISPTDIEGRQRNEYYPTDEEYLYAIADAMREEYQGIVDAGLLLQVDDPRLVTYYLSNPQASIEDCREWAESEGRGSKPRSQRHPSGKGTLPHLLRHQRRPKGPRNAPERNCRHHAQGQCRRLLLRGGQPGPRA